MAQEHVLYSDITQEHRARMLNLKKYYPFFKLAEVSFDTFRQGQYMQLDMGYIVMAVLRFFIEENNFKEKDVTYPEYVEFIKNCLRRDFELVADENESKEIADYIFDKIKNDGKPFEFEYYDPVDRKKRVSRIKLIDSTIRNSTVWYSISPDAIEFYLDTKEIKEESRISIQQLLLEKMIRARDFRGGSQVVERINDEVERLMLKKREVEALLSSDVFAGLTAYQDFVDNGMKWFEDEQRLFVKNKELIEAALARMESQTRKSTEGFLRAVDDIYELDHQLKVAMNRHSELLGACIQMQKLTDDIVRRNKLSRLRSHCDYRQMLGQMMRAGRIEPLEWMVKAMLKPRAVKRFNITSIDECLRLRTASLQEAEDADKEQAGDIVFDDELEDARISYNYGFFIRNILRKFRECESFSLSEWNESLIRWYGEQADKIFKNGDYYSFLANLCQKTRYSVGADEAEQESFLDAIIRKEISSDDIEGEAFRFIIEMGDKVLHPDNNTSIGEIIFKKQPEN